MKRKDNIKYLLQWIKVAAAFFLLLAAAFCFLQTMREGRLFKLGEGNLKIFCGWEEKVEAALRGWAAFGNPGIAPAFLIVGILLCGLWEIWEEAGGFFFFFL